MIDLTPLDVRKKRDDLRKVMRGYDPGEVDTFLQMVADRLEEVVRENMALKERNGFLENQVESSTGREKAVQEALVSAQTLRQEVKEQAIREADLLRKEAEMDLRALLDGAEERLRSEREALRELLRYRSRILLGLRGFLERELSTVVGEEERDPMEDLPESIREGLESREKRAGARARMVIVGRKESASGGEEREAPSLDSVQELPSDDGHGDPGSDGLKLPDPVPDEPSGSLDPDTPSQPGKDGGSGVGSDEGRGKQ
ncbi:MAG: DivIVA domain-containing protein [Gemmatimonadota bacterium]